MAKTEQFFSTIEDMNRGRVLIDIEDQLKKICVEVAENGGSGVLTLQLKVMATKRGMTEVTAKVSSKLPTPKPEPAVFFLNDRNELVRDDPKQSDLPGIVPMRREDVPAAREHNA